VEALALLRQRIQAGYVPVLNSGIREAKRARLAAKAAAKAAAAPAAKAAAVMVRFEASAPTVRTLAARESAAAYSAQVAARVEAARAEAARAEAARQARRQARRQAKRLAILAARAELFSQYAAESPDFQEAAEMAVRRYARAYRAAGMAA
jgi:hypothetical protein